MQNTRSLARPLVAERRTSRAWHRTMMNMSLVTIAVMAIGLAFLFLSARPSKDTPPVKSVEEKLATVREMLARLPPQNQKDMFSAHLIPQSKRIFANFLQRHGSSAPRWKTRESLPPRYQFEDAIEFSHRVNAGSKSAVAQPTAAVRYASHNRSACTGQSLSGVTYHFPNGMELTATSTMDGRHLFSAMMYCGQDPACGGFTQKPNGNVHSFFQPVGFSVNTSEELVGYHCIEKMTDYAVTNIPNNLTSTSDVDSLSYDVEYGSMIDYCQKIGPIVSEERRFCAIDRIAYYMEFLFGKHFFSPFAFYLMSDGDMKIDGTYAEARINAAREYTDRTKSICENSLTLPPTSGVDWGSNLEQFKEWQCID